MIWVVPGETRRGMRLEEAKRIGQEIPPRVQLIHCEDHTPQRCLELAKIRPACIILDGSREFTAFPCGERVRWLQRFSPQAKLLGLIDTDQPVRRKRWPGALSRRLPRIPCSSGPPRRRWKNSASR